MDIFDLLLGPGERGEQERIRRLAKQVSRDSPQDRGKSAMARRAVSETGFLGLALLTMEQLLVEKGLITRQEFAERLRRLDELDGVRNGEIDQRTLMSALGIGVGAAAPAKPVPVARLAGAPAPPAGHGKPAKPGAASRPEGRPAARPGGKPAAGARPAEPPPSGRPAEKPGAVTGTRPAPAPPSTPAAPEAQPRPEAAPLDPSKLGQTAFEDYFGQEKAEDHK